MLVDQQFFSNFYLLWFFSNLSFFERDPHMDSPEGIRVKRPHLFFLIIVQYQKKIVKNPQASAVNKDIYKFNARRVHGKAIEEKTTNTVQVSKSGQTFTHKSFKTLNIKIFKHLIFPFAALLGPEHTIHWVISVCVQVCGANTQGSFSVLSDSRIFSSGLAVICRYWQRLVMSK